MTLDSVVWLHQVGLSPRSLEGGPGDLRVLSGHISCLAGAWCLLLERELASTQEFLSAILGLLQQQEISPRVPPGVCLWYCNV